MKCKIIYLGPVILLSILLLLLNAGCTGKAKDDFAAQDDLLKALLDASSRKSSLSENPVPRNLGLDASTISKALDFITQNRNYRSYHLLFLIKYNSPVHYQTISGKIRSEILTSMLSEALFFNDWSILSPDGSIDKVAGNEILSLNEGDGIIALLSALLDNDDEAPFWGSDSTAIASNYDYRKYDFAYRYISIIKFKENPVFFRSAQERKALIYTFKKRLRDEGEEKEGRIQF